jgi:8-oxo-dGTP diphosphatase
VAVAEASKTESRSRKLVVAGLLIDGERVLITQRRKDQPMPLKWEFPGGKMEAGESPEAALKRELLEEIGVEVRVGAVWEVLWHAYPDFDLLMLVYPCSASGEGEPRCCEVADLAWVWPSEMPSYDILEADAPIVERLQDEGVPASPADFD